MITQLSCILREATKKETDPIHILASPTHEPFSESLSKTNQNFYLWQDKCFRQWNIKCRPLPKNHTLINLGQMPPWLDIDVVLSQNKFGQFQILSKFAQQLRIPLISLEHTQPYNTWTRSHILELKKMSGNINVFISEYSRDRWLYTEKDSVVIHHGIDTDLYTNLLLERKPQVLSVCNDFVNRDVPCGFTMWRNVTGYPDKIQFPVRILGDTPGLSKATSSTEELIKEYNESLIFLNTSQFSPIPMSLLESMACGCVPISTATCMIPSIIEHGRNGLLSNNPLELRQYCLDLLKNPQLARKLGREARQTILDKFPLNKFVENWNNLFQKALTL
jgi:glycosyltransferase involved in cell wall biosynthesis